MEEMCVLLLVFLISDLEASLADSYYQIVILDNINSQLMILCIEKCTKRSELE